MKGRCLTGFHSQEPTAVMLILLFLWNRPLHGFRQ